MAYPSAVRCHYGHPDLWNKLFSMTRGGISKVSRVCVCVFVCMCTLNRQLVCACDGPARTFTLNRTAIHDLHQPHDHPHPHHRHRYRHRPTRRST